jgi:Domain of unknown function (DUF4276)
MGAKKILFIEGEPNTPNGDLRQGFTKLLEKRIEGNLPRINLGGGKSHTIRKFLKNKLEADTFMLLVDLDGPEEEKEQDMKENGLHSKKETVFYMVQEMETWFLSQPDMLDSFFGVDHKGKKVSDKLSKRKVTDISDPKAELKNATKDSKRGEYHEIKHGVELLKLLDAKQLEGSFVDFSNLIELLKE